MLSASSTPTNLAVDHEYIEFCERRRVEEMGSEASSDSEGGSETAGDS